MAYRLLTIIMIAVLSVGCLVGCGNNEDTETDEPIVKTDAEYQAQAEKEITEENVDAALDELEKEIEQDMTP